MGGRVYASYVTGKKTSIDVNYREIRCGIPRAIVAWKTSRTIHSCPRLGAICRAKNAFEINMCNERVSIHRKREDFVSIKSGINPSIGWSCPGLAEVCRNVHHLPTSEDIASDSANELCIVPCGIVCSSPCAT